MNRRQRYLRTAIVSIVASGMILIPIAALDDPRPSFFGWHMYAANRWSPQIEVTLTDGSTEARDLGSIAARVRPEIDYREAVAQFLCEGDPTILSVRLDSDEPHLDGEYQCSAL